MLHVKQHVRPEELWILVIVRGSAITPLLREKGESHKSLANSLTITPCCNSCRVEGETASRILVNIS